MKTKLKPIHGVLLVAILGIWGAVALQIADAVREEEPPVASGSIVRRAGMSEAGGVSFSSNLRDPFRWGSTRKDSVRKHPPKPTDPAAVWQPPQMRLVGIVMGASGRTALVEMPDNSTVFLSQGDTLDGLRMVHIGSKTVQYAFNGRTGVWAVE